MLHIKSGGKNLLGQFVCLANSVICNLVARLRGLHNTDALINAELMHKVACYLQCQSILYHILFVPRNRQTTFFQQELKLSASHASQHRHQRRAPALLTGTRFKVFRAIHVTRACCWALVYPFPHHLRRSLNYHMPTSILLLLSHSFYFDFSHKISIFFIFTIPKLHISKLATVINISRSIVWIFHEPCKINKSFLDRLSLIPKIVFICNDWISSLMKKIVYKSYEWKSRRSRAKI